MAKAHKLPPNPNVPTPFLKEYTHYALSRFFEEFDSVGLYICPGESLQIQYQSEWFREVIFDAAIKSGKNPLLVIRDWTLDMGFRNVELRPCWVDRFIFQPCLVAGPKRQPNTFFSKLGGWF